MNDTSTDRTRDYEDAAVFVTATDDGLAYILRPLIDLIISIRVADCEQAFDAYLCDVRYDLGNQAQLVCRHIDEHCDPVGTTWTVPVNEIAHIHIW